MKRKFSWRSFISFCLFFILFIIIISGFILYVAPPGRISNWTNWQLFGLTKMQWQTMHTNFSYLFAILSILHLFTINWRTFWTYIRSKARPGLNRKSEFYIALSLTIAVLLGAVYLLPPFSSVMTLGENLKEGWEQEYMSPPVPHAEEYSIASLSSDLLNIPEENVLLKLEELGIEVESNEQTLKELAKQIDLTPQNIYSELALSSPGQDNRIMPGQGIGRKSLMQIAAENNIPVDEILTQLKMKGIDAKGEDIMRDLADRYKLNPSELLSIMNGGTLSP